MAAAKPRQQQNKNLTEHKAAPGEGIAWAKLHANCWRSCLNTIFMIASEDPKAGGNGPRRLFTGGADMIGYLLFLLPMVILGVKVMLISGPP